MKLYFKGHEYKYAVEQMLLTLYPNERPEYPAGKPEGVRFELRLSRSDKRVTASCLFCDGEHQWRGRSAAELSRVGTGVAADSCCQRLIKNAMYKAALASGHERPAWGALTGVRPGKLLHGMLEEGLSEKKALSRFKEYYDVSSERAELCMDTTRATVQAAAGLKAGDVCLYVGIPFCPTRCAYCSFVSQSVEKSMKLIPPFLTALEQEISATAACVKSLGLRVVSVYMGGGTPTTLSARQLDRLISTLEAEFDLSNISEYTVEAGRPDTITAEKLEVLRRHGVTRISVNPQTMSDSVLEAIGRRHTARDIVDALDKVRACGGMAVNMDIIAGLPSDSTEGFAETVDRVLALEPENITVHTLSLKNGSRIMLEGAPLPGAAQVGEMLELAGRRLRACGYAPYYLYRQKFMSGGFENVGWAKKSFVNLYNICIMEELCSIIAMGGGGSTKLIGSGGGRNERIMEPKYPLEYINSIAKTCANKKKIADYFICKEE